MLSRHAESVARRHGDPGQNLARKHDILRAGKSGVSVPQYGNGGDVYERRRESASSSAKVARRVGSQRRIEGITNSAAPRNQRTLFARHVRVFEGNSFAANVARAESLR